MITIFTDGSCVNGYPGNMGCGYIIMKDGKLLEGLAVPVGIGSSNVAEVHAALRGIRESKKYLKNDEQLMVVSDSRFLLSNLLRIERVAQDPSMIAFGLFVKIYDELLSLKENNNFLRTFGIKGHNKILGNMLSHNLAYNSAVSQTFYKPVQKGKGLEFLLH